MSVSNQLKQSPGSRHQNSQPAILTAEMISFWAVRARWAEDHNLWSHLDRGCKVLQTDEELDQYLYSYGPMTARQWACILDEATLPPGDFAVIDYAAGQGLATIHLMDWLGRSNRGRLKKCTITDISGPALRRAAEILRIYSEGLKVTCSEKGLDEIEGADLYCGDDNSFVHLFSNIVDIDSFDLPGLLAKVLDKKGRHQLLAVSPYRDFKGGDNRFNELSNWLIEAHQCGKIKLDGEVKQKTFRDEKGGRHSLCVASCEVKNGSL